jgi:hypothetical protein
LGKNRRRIHAAKALSPLRSASAVQKLPPKPRKFSSGGGKVAGKLDEALAKAKSLLGP